MVLMMMMMIMLTMMRRRISINDINGKELRIYTYIQIIMYATTYEYIINPLKKKHDIYYE